MPPDLRALARERLTAGTLPRRRARVIFAGVPGRDHRCALCDEPLTGLVEIRATLQDDTVLYFHGACHWAWDVERDAMQQ